MKFLQLFLFFIVINTFGQNKTQSIGFIENKGQIIDQKGRKNNSVKFLLNTNGLNVQLRENGFSYDVYEIKKLPLKAKEKKKLYKPNVSSNDTLKYRNFSLEYIYHRIDIDFENSNKSVKLIAENKSSDYDNYYNVPNEPNGITNVYKYQKVTYKNIYNNIDVVFFLPEDKTKSVEYNFIINEGGKISDIELKFNGVKTELTNNKIKMLVRFGTMEETLPLSWIENNNQKREVPITYKKIQNGVYGFSSAENFTDKTLIIDPTPVRLWGTFYGGMDGNYINFKGDVDHDSNGNIYLVGSNSSLASNFATSGTHQGVTNPVSVDGYIAKFNNTGSRIWGTFYGGSNTDVISDLKIDYQNNIVVTGETYSSTNISTSNTHSLNLSGFEDAFVAKFNTSGIRIWGTYFGGEADDYGYDVDVDINNNIYIVGKTRSYSGISIDNNFQPLLNTVGTISNASFDGFIAKFNINGQCSWATYCGGDSNDELFAIKVSIDFLVVGGYTIGSTNISTSGAHQQTTTSFIDGIIYKFSLNGVREWSSYYGGQGTEKIRAVDIDSYGNIYFGGDTNSSDNIASVDSYDNFNQYQETGFLVKFNTVGQRLWGTFLGSSVKLFSIELQSNDYVYIGGNGGNSSTSTVALTNDCSYKSSGFAEGYIGKFSNFGTLIWGTFVGGFDQYSESKISLFGNKISIGGSTSSVNNSNIASPGAHQQSFTGSSSNYLMSFEDSSECITPSLPESNSPVCINNTISLSAPNGYNYQWSGPNGFSSSVQNPTILNSEILNSGIYNLTISNNCNCSKSYSINVQVGDTTKPVPNINPLPSIISDCNTIVSTIPTATDNCAGTIYGTTTEPLTYSLPGTYTINWSYNDGNGNIETQTQNIIISSVSLPTLTSPQTFCIQQNATLNDIIISGSNIKWYDALTTGNLLSNSTILVDGTTYYASQTINGCESLRIPVTISIQNTIAPSGDSNQILCSTSNPTLSDLIVTGTSINWYASNSITTILPNSTALVDGVTYFATQTINSCESVNRFPITVSIINSLNANDYSQSFCDDMNDGIENVILSDYNSNLISSTASTTFTYYSNLIDAENQIVSELLNSNYNLNLGLNTIYVRLDSTNGCHQVVKLELSLFQKPIISINGIIPICKSTNINVNAGSGFNSYLWSNGATTQSISISTPGTYTVTVTKNYGTLICSSTKSFDVVESEIATIASIETEDWTDVENVIIVLTTLNDNYQYSLDGINYQASNTFSGLTSGFYTVYIKDECGIVKEDVVLLNYPKFFTPNGDGTNDYWKIKFSQFEPNLTITIFDRYGKTIKVLNPNSAGWDGTYNGVEMISDDYWFVVKREDGREHRGHFAMKR